jgi:hypothetical protein
MSSVSRNLHVERIEKPPGTLRSEFEEVFGFTAIILRFYVLPLYHNRINHQTLNPKKMKSLKRNLLIVLFFLPFLLHATEKEVPFTFEDRDRIIRTEQKVEALEKKINSKVDDLRSEMNARFDQLFNFLWAIIGIFTTMMVSVFGFAFWDRRLSLRPMKEEQRNVLGVLRDYAEHQPRLREILKNTGLM